MQRNYTWEFYFFANDQASSVARARIVAPTHSEAIRKFEEGWPDNAGVTRFERKNEVYV